MTMGTTYGDCWHTVCRAGSLVLALALSLPILSALQGCSTEDPTRNQSGGTRFIDVGNGTVTDKTTGLIWAKDANLPGISSAFDGLTWNEAVAFVSDMDAGRKPNMGYADWRLPSRGELSGLIGGFWVEPGGVKRFLRAGGPQWFSEDDRSGLTRGSTEPFVNYTEAAYWSSETNDADTAWAIDNRGKPLLQTKASGKRVWPVRNR